MRIGRQSRVTGPGQRSSSGLSPRLNLERLVRHHARHNEVGVSPRPLASFTRPSTRSLSTNKNPERAPQGLRFSVSVRANVDPLLPPPPLCWSGSRDNDRVGRRTVIEVAVSQRHPLRPRPAGRRFASIPGPSPFTNLSLFKSFSAIVQDTIPRSSTLYS